MNVNICYLFLKNKWNQYLNIMKKCLIGMIKALKEDCKDATHNRYYLYNCNIYNRNRVLKGERR